MKVYTLERSQTLNSTLEEVWDYFSSPKNLDELTPKNMGFQIVTELDSKGMYQGQEIEYYVRPILNIPLYWKTLISEVDTHKSFIDQQIKGPYKLWRHKHTFEEVNGKVRMHDKVEYALPFNFLGSIAHAVFVKQRLDEIFDYRYKMVDKIFN